MRGILQRSGGSDPDQESVDALAHYGLNDESRSDWNTDIYDFYLSGPEPITSRRSTPSS